MSLKRLITGDHVDGVHQVLLETTLNHMVLETLPIHVVLEILLVHVVLETRRAHVIQIDLILLTQKVPNYP